MGKKIWSVPCTVNFEWFFGVVDFLQKTNENKSTWGIIVVKSNSFVHFLEETSAWKNHFDFVWPLVERKPEGRGINYAPAQVRGLIQFLQKCLKSGQNKKGQKIF